MNHRIAAPRKAGLAFLILAVGLAGCQPGYYRRQADAEAYCLIEEKTQDPRWALTDYDITPDPRSRIFDPFDPDHEPMPPDDPESHRLMHQVDGKKGFKHWHDNGDTAFVENPEWLALLPLNEEGALVLNAEQAVDLARLHSRDYQRNLQELYLSALEVSFQRFRFDAQFFGGYQTEYRADGPLRSPAGSQSILTAATFPSSRGIRMEKLGTTGTELVVGFANSFVWQFSGSDSYSASSVLDFSLIQPLLRFAGRARVMEGLTQSERTLLSNVRQMERYRHGFYLEIMTGVDAGTGPSPIGGGIDSSLLQGFSGVGASGFMGLLQTQQEILNQRFNLYALRSNHFRLNATLQDLLSRAGNLAARQGEGGGSNSEGIVRQRLQVAQARQAILNAESRLNDAEVAYQRRLDEYKMSLGLPPTLCVKIEDRMLEPLNLIDRGIVDLQERVSATQVRVGEDLANVQSLLLDRTVDDAERNERVAKALRAVRAELDQVTDLRRRLIEADDAPYRRLHADGRKLLQGLETSLQAAIREAADDPADRDALRQDLRLLQDIRQQLRMAAGDEAAEGDWLSHVREFMNFNLLEDLLHDLDRVNDELKAEERTVDVSWMKGDPNPLTRSFYRRHRDVMAARDTPQVARLAETARREYERIRAQHPWLSELSRWRQLPYEAEVTISGGNRARATRLQRRVSQFVDIFLDSLARLDVSDTHDGLLANIQQYQTTLDSLAQSVATLTPDEVLAQYRLDVNPAIPQELVDLANNVLEISLVQSRTRAENVSIRETAIDLHPQAAVEIARQNRLDWMNERARLVDRWRLIRFYANDLRSDLDVEFSGDMTTRDDNPFKFDSRTGQLRAGLKFDSPLTRLSERNTYRQALIDYQQARMDYFEAEDQIAKDLRDVIRRLQLAQRNLEIRREAVWAAAVQIELNQEIRNLGQASSQASGPTATRDAVSALSDLLTAQNEFLNIWVTYEVLRRTLDFGLGTMQLDAAGMWIDPGAINPERGYPGIGTSTDCWPGPLVMPGGESTHGDPGRFGTEAEEVPPPAGEAVESIPE
jgi:hypothetical protein